VVADKLSSVSITLQNQSSLTDAINADKVAKEVNVTLDATSTCLNDVAGISGTIITNIVGNGFTVYYDTSACPALKGATYTLNGGGYLKPVN